MQREFYCPEIPSQFIRTLGEFDTTIGRVRLENIVPICRSLLNHALTLIGNAPFANNLPVDYHATFDPTRIQQYLEHSAQVFDALALVVPKNIIGPGFPLVNVPLTSMNLEFLRVNAAVDVNIPRYLAVRDNADEATITAFINGLVPPAIPAVPNPFAVCNLANLAPALAFLQEKSAQLVQDFNVTNTSYDIFVPRDHGNAH